MSVLGYTQCLVSSQIDSTALSNSTTATSIIPAAARFAIPANFFYIGKQLLVKATGRISTVVTTPGNITFDFRLGVQGTPIVVFNGGATALNTTAQTNATWYLELLLTCRAIGSGTTANIMGTGQWSSRASLGSPLVGSTTGVGTVLLPDTAPAVGTGFDSTVVNMADMFATFSIANASNSITTHEYSLWDVN